MRSKIRKVSLMFLLCTFVLVLGACDKGKQKDNKIQLNEGDNLIQINADGSVTNRIAEKFDKEKYSKDDLEKDVEAELAEFNGADKAITLESLKEEDSNMVIEFKAKSIEDFANYYKKYVTGSKKTDLFYGTIQEAVAAGYKVPDSFNKAEEGGGTVDFATVKGDSSLKVVITNIGCKLKVDGDVAYFSDDIKISDGIAELKADAENYIFYKNVKEEK